MAKTSDNSEGQPLRPGRPRDKRVDTLVLEATRNLLIQVGYKELSFESISQQTGVSRATIYRRWPSKMALVTAIVTADYGSQLAPSDDAGFRERLQNWIQSAFEYFARPEIRAAAVGLMTEHTAAVAMRRPRVDSARILFEDIVHRAIKKGEIRPDVDASALFDIAMGSIGFKAINTGTPLKRKLVSSICDIICNGVVIKP